jgi:UDP-N-acetylglucosamine:LPS N-acetylglucosamine transferase
MSNGRKQAKRVLAVASSGGHWVQLQRLSEAWAGCDTSFVCTRLLRQQPEGENAAAAAVQGKLCLVRPASRWDKLGIGILTLQIIMVLVRVRPEVVVTTGALPGLLAIVGGKLLGARTVWIDSIANADEVSMSGRTAGRWADLWLTQWPHLENSTCRSGKTIVYRGSVI